MFLCREIYGLVSIYAIKKIKKDKTIHTQILPAGSLMMLTLLTHLSSVHLPWNSRVSCYSPDFLKHVMCLSLGEEQDPGRTPGSLLLGQEMAETLAVQTRNYFHLPNHHFLLTFGPVFQCVHFSKVQTQLSVHAYGSLLLTNFSLV